MLTMLHLPLNLVHVRSKDPPQKIAELELPVARIIPRNNARARPEETGGSLLALEVDVAVAYELSPAI